MLSRNDCAHLAGTIDFLQAGPVCWIFLQLPDSSFFPM